MAGKLQLNLIDADLLYEALEETSAAFGEDVDMFDSMDVVIFDSRRPMQTRMWAGWVCQTLLAYVGELEEDDILRSRAIYPARVAMRHSRDCYMGRSCAVYKGDIIVAITGNDPVRTRQVLDRLASHIVWLLTPNSY